MVVEQQNLDLLNLAQPALIGDKERGICLNRGRDLQSIGNMNLVCCSQDDGPAGERGVNGQRLDLLRVQEGTLIGLYQIKPPLSLRVYAGFDQGDDRCNPLHLGLFEVAE